MNPVAPTQPTGTTCTAYTRLQDLPPDALQAMAADTLAGLYGSPAWYGNLLRSVDFGAGAQPAFHVLRRAGEVRLVLPLMVVAEARLATSLANFYAPLAAPAAHPNTDRADWATLFNAVRAAHPRVAELRLGPLPMGAEVADSPPAQGLRDAGYRVQPFFSFGNWFLANPPPWATYWAARPAALRNTVERKGRRFAKLGGRLEVITQGADLERGVAAFQAVYADSWKGAEPHPHFMPGLLRLAADQGALRLGVAWLNGEAVAAQAWFCAQGRADIYKLAYRERHRELGAGSLLTALLMQHAITEDRVHEVDYLMGDDAYKPTWVNQRRERWSLAAFDGHSVHGQLAWLKQAAGRMLRHWRKPAQPLPA